MSDGNTLARAHTRPTFLTRWRHILAGYEPSEPSESEKDSDSESEDEGGDADGAAAEEKADDGQGEGPTPLLRNGEDDDAQSNITAATGLDDDLSLVGGVGRGALAKPDPRDGEGELVVRAETPEEEPMLTLEGARAAAAVEADLAHKRMMRKRKAMEDEARRKKEDAEKEVSDHYLAARAREPYIDSVLRASNPSSVFLTCA